MRTITMLALAAALAAAAGCQAVPPPDPAALERSLIETDRAFAARAREAGEAVAFAEFMAPDGKMLSGSGAPVIGTDAIFSAMSALPEGAALVWEPVEAVVSTSGDLGVTWGDYRYQAPGEDGAMIEETGRYLTVWRRQPDGGWRAVFDIGT